MSGCFGNSSYDRWLESQVNDFCSQDEMIVICSCCNAELYEVMKDDDFGGFYCPECYTEVSRLDYDFLDDMDYVKPNNDQHEKIIDKYNADYEKYYKKRGYKNGKN